MTSRSTHGSLWHDLRRKSEQHTWDLVVIGGGITGAGILREAVRMGLKTLLVEKRDFAWGTSSRSSKLVHGGLRYLKEGRIRLTHDSIVERERLLKESGNLVTPLPFLIPIYKGQKPGRWTFAAGLTLYDLIAKHLEHRHLDSQELQMMAPHMDPENLEGGLRYKDAQTDDSRLVLRLIFEAETAGATALNYVSAAPPSRKNGQVVGVTLRDEIGGEACFVRTRLAVNATGVWADRLRDRAESCLRPLRGSHLVFPAWRLPAPQAITILHPKDHRPVFLLPWEGASIFGTTDMDHRDSLDEEPRISTEEVHYLLTAIQEKMPALGITARDILSTFAGVRPVISTGAADPTKESRDHEIWDENGLLTITGGKLTTFRKMAFDLLKLAMPYFSGKPSLVKTAPVFAEAAQAWPPDAGLDRFMGQRFLARYGSRAVEVAAAACDGELTTIPGTQATWAELRWAARAEKVVKLEDLMLRRLRLGLLLPEGGRGILESVRLICREELGWNEERWQVEQQAYLALWDRCYSLPS